MLVRGCACVTPCRSRCYFIYLLLCFLAKKPKVVKLRLGPRSRAARLLTLVCGLGLQRYSTSRSMTFKTRAPHATRKLKIVFKYTTRRRPWLGRLRPTYTALASTYTLQLHSYSHGKQSQCRAWAVGRASVQLHTMPERRAPAWPPGS